MSKSTTPPTMNTTANNSQQLSPLTQALILNGSVSLKSQMMAMSAQNNNSPANAMRPVQPEQQQLQPRARTQPHLDPNILSRMVTAPEGKGAARMPIRMASMQEFRRSVSSLNTVPESARRLQNQAFDLGDARRATLATPVCRPMASENPLLKMMEQRMAAQKESPPPAAMNNGEKAALRASISKWSGVGDAASSLQTQVEESAKPGVKQPVAGSPQTSSVQGSHSSGRVPLSTSQVSLLEELAASQQVKKEVPVPQMSQNKLLQQQFFAQFNEQHANGMASAQQAPARLYLPTRTSTRPGLTRCAASSAEVDRLRRENQSIQLQQGLILQERAMQEQLREQQAYLHQRNIAISALVSMQQNHGGQAALTQENQFQAAHALNAGNQSQLFNMIKSLSGEVSSSRSTSSLRKRRSLGTDCDDDSCCSGVSTSSNTHSVTSSSASSFKIHRSMSQRSARTALSGSMENLRVGSQSRLNGSFQNKSFSSLHAGNQSCSSGINMKNQSFSSGLNPALSQHLHASSALVQRNSSQTALRRSSSSSNWIKSILSDQLSAGKAAATFETALQNSNQSLAAPQHEQLIPSAKAKETVALPKPIQVQAEEFCAPPTERAPSTSSETVIVSALPDRIKYQNVKAVTNPLDVVKEALSSRGAKCDTKPSIDMDESFFVNVNEMYSQEVVNAIRSGDVESLRKMNADGVNLQCGNKFGETLIHLACRRSSLDLVSLLVNDAGVSLCVRDDFGRTPMHDACWRAQPDLELLDMLLDKAPQLLMLSDKRGHTPLDYARREHWDVLVPFLLERAGKFRSV